MVMYSRVTPSQPASVMALAARAASAATWVDSVNARPMLWVAGVTTVLLPHMALVLRAARCVTAVLLVPWITSVTSRLVSHCSAFLLCC